MLGVKRPESVEVPLPSTAEGFFGSPQTYQGFSAPPPLKVKGFVPTMSKGVCGLVTRESGSQVTSPVPYYSIWCGESRFRQSRFRQSRFRQSMSRLDFSSGAGELQCTLRIALNPTAPPKSRVCSSGLIQRTTASLLTFMPTLLSSATISLTDQNCLSGEDRSQLYRSPKLTQVWTRQARRWVPASAPPVSREACASRQR